MSKSRFEHSLTLNNEMSLRQINSPPSQAVVANEIIFQWETHSHKAFRIFQEMRAKEELCDVYICCDGRRFPAHRVVLAATCPFFREKLAAEHDESECEESFVELEIPWNFDNLLILNALDFLYEGKLILQLDHIKELLQLLHYLKVI